jgi:hypothetical protein
MLSKFSRPELLVLCNMELQQKYPGVRLSGIGSPLALPAAATGSNWSSFTLATPAGSSSLNARMATRLVLNFAARNLIDE